MAQAIFRGRVDPKPPFYSWATKAEEDERRAKFKRLFPDEYGETWDGPSPKPSSVDDVTMR